MYRKPLVWLNAIVFFYGFMPYHWWHTPLMTTPTRDMTEERKPQSADKYIVRFPDGMRDRIKQAAEANNRSMNSEIIARLEQSLAEHHVQLDSSTYALSTTEKLQAQLVASEGQRNALSTHTLHISAGLAAAYPFAKAVMSADPDTERTVGPVIDHGMSVAKDFAFKYEPQGIERTLRTLENIRQTLGPAMKHLSVGQWDDFSDIFDAQANEMLKNRERRMVDSILDVATKYGISGSSGYEQASKKLENESISEETTVRKEQENPEIQISKDRMALIKNLATEAKPKKSSTPSIPGVNAPKGGAKAPKK